MRQAVVLQQHTLPLLLRGGIDGEGAFMAEQIAELIGPGCLVDNVRAYWPLLRQALKEQGIDDRATQIAALATIGVECPVFLPIEEYRNLDGSYPDYWYGYDGGPDYHGRGFIQLTHRSNYDACGRALGVDLVNNPNWALDPDVAVRALAWFFKEHGIPELAARGEWLQLRIRVNGINPDTGLPNGWTEFKRLVDALEPLAGR